MRASVRTWVGSVLLATLVVLATGTGTSAAGGPTCFGQEATIVGTSGADVIVATRRARPVIVALGGDDIIRGLGDRALVCAGDGNDLVVDGNRSAQMDGGPGVDTISFETATAGMTVDVGAGTANGGGPDTFTAFEIVRGSSLADDLFGSDGADTLVGGGGADLLQSFGGNDNLIGEGGDDTLRGGDGTDVANGGDGTDACVDAETTGTCERGGGTLTNLLATDVDYTDPALSYLFTTWQLEYATCLKLVNYADTASPTAIVPTPEAATGSPLVSADGKTYTFTIRNGMRFAPPSTELVTAATFKHVFERIQSPQLQSPAKPFIGDVASVDAQGQTLTITLSASHPDFLTRLTMPFFCAVPVNTPMSDPNGVLAPGSAGPYVITSRTPNVQITAVRNANYRGRRPSNFDQIVYHIGDSLEVAKMNVESGAADYAAGGIPPTAYAEVAGLYGPGSPAAALGRQRFFVNPQLGFSYLALNTSRPVFANKTLRQAVAYAIDRDILLAQGGVFAGTRTDQYLPPGMPGYVDEAIYPPGGDLVQAQALAASQGVTPATPVTVELYTSNRAPAPQRAQILKTRLAQIGINVTIHEFPRAEQIQREGTRGEPFDIGTEGWIADYNDPSNILQLLDGRTIRDSGNINFSYFDDAVFNERIEAASQLNGQARYDAYAELEHDLVRAAPLVAISNYNSRDYFADRIGCQQYGTFGMSLGSLCIH